MRAKWTTSGNAYRLFPVLAAILSITCIACSENPSGIHPVEEVAYDKGGVRMEYFKAYPSGSTIHAFDGSVILDFPPGTIPTTTRFSIVSFPLDDLDLKGNNVMLRAVLLKNVTNKNDFENPVDLIMRYDLCGFNMCEPGEESEIAIFRLLGDQYAFHKIEELGECCMNCACKTVQTCINECGAFVVVEK